VARELSIATGGSGSNIEAGLSNDGALQPDDSLYGSKRGEREARERTNERHIFY